MRPRVVASVMRKDVRATRLFVGLSVVLPVALAPWTVAEAGAALANGSGVGEAILQATSVPALPALVPVEDRIQVEVLDFSGTGRPIVLLAGLGDTAHVYDDFAPWLKDAGFHVYAMTRRGFGASSAPVAGYTFARLAADVVGVIDAMSLDRPIVVGHSIAGLVYLDAAVNRTRGPSADFQRAAAALPSPPPPTAEELRSYAALRGYFARTRTVTRPEAEVRASRVIAADGSIGALRGNR